MLVTATRRGQPHRIAMGRLTLLDLLRSLGGFKMIRWIYMPHHANMKLKDHKKAALGNSSTFTYVFGEKQEAM